MIRKPMVVSGAALGVLLLGWLQGSSFLQPSLVQANGIESLRDTDGDSLPDNLEWVLLSDPVRVDSDGDGRDDFLEVVQHTSVSQQTTVQPLDHEMRVAVSTSTDKPSGISYVWVHVLFRFATATPEVSWFMPFLSTGDALVPIRDMIGRTPMNWSVRTDAGQGTFGIFSMRLASVGDVSRIAPCTVNVRAAIEGRYLCSSTYVFLTNGELCTLVPHGRDVQNPRLTVQTLMSHDGTSNSSFSGNRQCEQTMTLTGTSPGGPVYEVASSECEISEGMRCGTDCTSQRGATIVAPDGMGAITGR